MKRNVRNSYVLVAAGGVALLLGGGVAFAFWTSSGGGEGEATAGTTAEVGITQFGSITSLYPDGPPASIVIDIVNANDSEVTIDEVTAEVSGTSNPNCTAADFAISGPVYAGGTLDGGATVRASGATIQMINDPLRNQDACKGVVVDLVFTASAITP